GAGLVRVADAVGDVVEAGRVGVAGRNGGAVGTGAGLACVAGAVDRATGAGGVVVLAAGVGRAVEASAALVVGVADAVEVAVVRIAAEFVGVAVFADAIVVERAHAVGKTGRLAGGGHAAVDAEAGLGGLAGAIGHLSGAEGVGE